MHNPPGEVGPDILAQAPQREVYIPVQEQCIVAAGVVDTHSSACNVAVAADTLSVRNTLLRVLPASTHSH